MFKTYKLLSDKFYSKERDKRAAICKKYRHYERSMKRDHGYAKTDEKWIVDEILAAECGRLRVMLGE